METITIQSEYKYSFNAYETTAITSKGIIRTRCIQLDKEKAEKWAEEENEKAPFYDETHKCIIYHVTVCEITICTR